MTLSELSRIDRTIEIRATPQRVWRALTSANELSTWFRVKIEGEIAAGQELWMTVTEAKHAGMRFSVHIVEMTPPRRFVWDWHPGAVDPAVDYSEEPFTRVTFTLEPSAKGTRLSLSETGFDHLSLERRAKAYQENSQGWTEVLQWLSDHAEAS